MLVSGRVERPNLDSEEVLEDVILDGREFFLSSGSALDLGMGGIPAFQVKHPVFFFFSDVFTFRVSCGKKHTHKKKP